MDKSLKDLKSEVLKLQSEIFTLKSGRRDDQLRIVTMVRCRPGAMPAVPFQAQEAERNQQVSWFLGGLGLNRLNTSGHSGG